MKKILYSVLIILFLLFGVHNVSAIPNPWVECGDDISCGASRAGFNFPLRVKNYSVRAMTDMMELTFPLDKKRQVTVRKSELYNAKADENGIKDISGDYNNYPINKTLWVEKSVPFNVRGYKSKFYVD